MKTGTIFDHVLVTDDLSEAEAFASGYFKQQQKGERSVYDKQEEEKRKEEEEKRKKEEAEKKAEEADEEEEEEEEEESAHEHDEL